MSQEQFPPPAEGVRIPWSAVPENLRLAVERHLGDRVAEAVTQPGGFSPGVAARLRLTGGGRAFVKAVGPEPNPDSPAFHRAEARVAAALPADVPAPRLLASFDQDGWVVLLFEDVEGRLPAQPWEPDELTLVLGALARMAEALTPAPIQVPAAAERFGDEFRGWRRLAADGADLTAVLDPWAVRHLPRLAELEERWGRAAEGACLAHADMRADNLLLTTDGRVLVVDWPHACLATPWFDLVGMLPSVTMQGGRHRPRSSTATRSRGTPTPAPSPPFSPRSPDTSCSGGSFPRRPACPPCVPSSSRRAGWR